MTDMPERIWASGVETNGSWTADRPPDEWGTGAAKYIRADLVPQWNRDLSAVPAGVRVLIATSDGLVLEARLVDHWDDDGREWETSDPTYEAGTPIAWQPLPRHPDEEGGE